MNEEGEWVWWCRWNLPLSYQTGHCWGRGGGVVALLVVIVQRIGRGRDVDRGRKEKEKCEGKICYFTKFDILIK